MSQINDAILAVVGPGQLNDELLIYYRVNSDDPTIEDLQDAEFAFLAFNGGGKSAIPDMWEAFLDAQGIAVGALADRKLTFWDGGGLAPTVAPIWTTDPPNAPDGVDGTAYNYNFTPDLNTTVGVVLTSTGAGGLPSGLSIVGLTLQGTPDTVLNNTNIQITATNGAGFDESLAFAIDIAAAAVAPVWTTDPPNAPDGTVDEAYNYDFTPDLNTVSGVVLTSTGGPLPSGLTIVGLTLQGTPDTVADTTNIRITATNGAGSDESLPFDIDVVAAEGLGPELLADPTFNQDAGQWSLQAGWTISGNQGHAAANATNTNGCQASTPAPALEDGVEYRVKITTLNGTYQNTGLRMQLDGLASVTIAMADGDHEIDLTTTNAQTIFRYRHESVGDFEGDFETASCKEVLAVLADLAGESAGSPGEFNEVGNWVETQNVTVGGGEAEFTGTPNDLRHENIGITNGKSYLMTVDVSGGTFAGLGMGIQLGSNTNLARIDANGTLVFIITADGTNDRIRFRSQGGDTFTGFIDNITLREIV